jgi:hypothetical protein
MSDTLPAYCEPGRTIAARWQIDARLAVLRRAREAREFDEARGRNPDEALARRLEMLTAKRP